MPHPIPLLFGLRSLQAACRFGICSLCKPRAVTCYNRTLYAPTSSKPFSTTHVSERNKPKGSNDKVSTGYVNEKIRLLDYNEVFIGEMVYWRAKQKAVKDGLNLLDLGKDKEGKGDIDASSDDDTVKEKLKCYKLVSDKDFHTYMKAKRKQEETGGKEIAIKARIDDNSLDIKLNAAKKRLPKGPVRFIIRQDRKLEQENNKERMNEIANKITRELSEEYNINKITGEFKTVLTVKSKVEKVKKTPKKWPKKEPVSESNS